MKSPGFAEGKSHTREDPSIESIRDVLAVYTARRERHEASPRKRPLPPAPIDPRRAPADGRAGMPGAERQPANPVPPDGRRRAAQPCACAAGGCSAVPISNALLRGRTEASQGRRKRRPEQDEEARCTASTAGLVSSSRTTMVSHVQKQEYSTYFGSECQSGLPVWARN